MDASVLLWRHRSATGFAGAVIGRKKTSESMGLFPPAVRIQTGNMILAAAVNPEKYRTAGDEIARLKRCDPDALTGMLSRYHQRLYRFLMRLVHDPATAEDLLRVGVASRSMRSRIENSYEYHKNSLTISRCFRL
jgi:hypothetical protein